VCVCSCMCDLFIQLNLFPNESPLPGPRHTLRCFDAFSCAPLPPLPFSIFNNVFSLFKKKSNGNWRDGSYQNTLERYSVCKPGVLQTSPQSSLCLDLILLLYLQTALLSKHRNHDKEKLWCLWACRNIWCFQMIYNESVP